MKHVAIIGQGPNQKCWEESLRLAAQHGHRREVQLRWAENRCARLSCTGSIGRKLASLAGYDLKQREELRFYASVERINLNARFNGKSGQGDVFDEAEARRTWESILRKADGGTSFVLLGLAVAKAVGFKEPEMLSVHGQRIAGLPGFLIFPHPSGLSRWWNVPGNTALASKALTTFLARHGVQASTRPKIAWPATSAKSELRGADQPDE